MTSLNKLPYHEFMNTIFEYHKKNWKNGFCDKCGGTGFVPVMCCDGQDCGCQGKPVDFDVTCDACGKIGDIKT